MDVFATEGVAASALIKVIQPMNTLALSVAGQSIFENLMGTSIYYETLRVGYSVLVGYDAALFRIP